MTHDGLGKYLSQIIEKAPGPTADIVGILKEREVDVMVSYLPVGSEEATKWYVEQALQAGVGFINAIPVFIGREPYWQRRFAEEGLPIIGDDIKSQVGATISHRVLTRLFMDRGVRLDRTYQLNFGGNTDFLNMLERERLESKKISKTNAVTSMLDYELDPDDIHVGPCDHVPWLKDRKWCYIRMEGTTFGDVPLNAELKLEVWDSPNSAGVITDAIRCLKLGLDRGLAGTLVAPSSYFMKSPPHQIHDDIAFNRVEAFIRGEDNETLVGTETRPPSASADRRHRAPRSRPRPSSGDGPVSMTERSGGSTARIDPGTRTPSAPGGVGARPASPRLAGRRLDEPVRRARERAVVVGYRFAAWLLGVVPLGISLPVAGGAMRLGATALWPPKRRIILANASHVLGRPTERPGACAAWRGGSTQTYARFIVELMRLPALPAGRAARLMDPAASAARRPSPLWDRLRAEGRGIIAVSGHIGSIEASSRPAPPRGIPTYGLADDSAYPELFDLIKAQRAAGVSRSSRGATSGASSRSCASRPCSAWWSTGATGPTTCRCASSATGRRCPPDQPCWRQGRARSSCPSSAAASADGRSPLSGSTPIEVGRGRLGRRSPACDAGDRRRARGHGPAGTRAVVHVQADLAGDGGGGRPSLAARAPWRARVTREPASPRLSRRAVRGSRRRAGLLGSPRSHAAPPDLSTLYGAASVGRSLQPDRRGDARART